MKPENHPAPRGRIGPARPIGTITLGTRRDRPTERPGPGPPPTERVDDAQKRRVARGDLGRVRTPIISGTPESWPRSGPTGGRLPAITMDLRSGDGAGP